MFSEDSKQNAPLPYHQWGGYPATVAALDGFEAARQSDPKLGSMFDKLDQLDRSSRSELFDVMEACRFEPEEVSRINSPVLDGLWKATTGRDPDGITLFARVLDRSKASFCLRLVFPRPYAQAFRWFMLRPCDDDWKSEHWYSPAFVVAAGLGVRDIVDCLHPICVERKDTQTACRAFERATLNGHVEVVQMMMSLMSDQIEGYFMHHHDEPLRLAATLGHTAVVAAILGHRPELSRTAEIPDVLLSTIAVGHEATAGLLLDAFHDRMTPDLYQAAFDNAMLCGKPGMIQLIVTAAQVAGVIVAASPFDMLGRQPHILVSDEQAVQRLLPFLPAPVENQIGFAHAVCSSGNLTLLKLLMHRGVLERHGLHSRHLVAAVEARSREMVLYILDQGGLTVWSDDALGSAAAMGDKEMTTCLLTFLAQHQPQRAADLQVVVDSGGLVGIVRSPLLVCRRASMLAIAAERGPLDVVEALLAHPHVASAMSPFLAGSAVTRAVPKGRVEVVERLVRFMDGNLLSCLQLAAPLNDSAMMRLLVDAFVAHQSTQEKCHLFVFGGPLRQACRAMLTAAACGRAANVVALLPLLKLFCVGYEELFDQVSAAASSVSDDGCLATAQILLAVSYTHLTLPTNREV